jgi:NAD(P)-dependent dehydrogenase (short-subunit alcohol dehydrogenase family)
MLHSPAVVAEADVKRYPGLAGKRVLIAGAERSFGRSIAKAFAREGARLVLQATRLGNVDWGGGNALRVFECRPRSADEVERLADAAATAHAGLDIAIAVTALPARWPDLRAADPEGPAAEALKLPFLAGRRIAERMHLKNIRGCLMTVATLPPAGGDHPVGRMLLATMLAAFVRRQAEDFAPFGICAFGIAAEPLVAPLSGRGANEPGIARMGRTKAVAETVLALAGDRARFLSGQTLTI